MTTAEAGARRAASAPVAATSESTGANDRGRTRVTSKALTNVITALAAEALQVSTSKVSVTLSDRDGALAVAVQSPIRVVSLSELRSDPRALERSQGTVLDRADRAQSSVRTRAQQLTGSVINSVTVRVTGVEIVQQKRVK